LPPESSLALPVHLVAISTVPTVATINTRVRRSAAAAISSLSFYLHYPFNHPPYTVVPFFLMAPRKTLRSSTSNDPSCSLSPPRRTDTPENVQHTTAVAGADAAEDRPPTARPRGSVIPDSQENPSDLEFSGDDLEDDLEAEQPTAGTKDQPSNAGTEEDLGAQQALPEVDDSQDSFNTVDTVIIPGGTKLTPRRNVSRYRKPQQSIKALLCSASLCTHVIFCKLGAYLCYISAVQYQIFQTYLRFLSATSSV